MDNEKFIAGDLSTKFLGEEYPDNNYTLLDDKLCENAAIAAALETFARERRITVSPSTSKQPSQWLTIHRKANLRTFTGSR